MEIKKKVHGGFKLMERMKGEKKKKKRKEKRHTKIERCGRTTKAQLRRGWRDDKGKLTVALN